MEKFGCNSPSRGILIDKGSLRLKKIVIVTPHLSGLGGTETVIRDVVRRINSGPGSYKIQLLVGGSDNTAWLAGIPSASYASGHGNKLARAYSKMRALYKYFKEERPSMVISIDTRLIRACYLCRKMLGHKFPIVSWIHFSLFHEPTVHVKMLPYADYHFCISTGIARQMESLGINPSVLFTIYNPVPRIERTVPRPKDKVKFIYIGRIFFERQKRLKDLLTALSGVSGDWQLNVYGDGEDTDICKQFSNQLGIQDRVIWNGWVDQAWEKIDEATALLLTSAYEGFGMVLTEAISRGVYCISSDCETGPADIIQQNVNGELYQPGDLSQLRIILQSIVDRRKPLPDQEKIKESIKSMYADHYYQTLLSDFDKISDDWNAK